MEQRFNEIVKLRNNIPNVKIKLLQETYRAIVESRMLYGVEVWEDISTKILIDRMRAKLAKLVLNLPLYASSDGARCEMGSISGLEIILVRVLKYYNYIMRKGEEDIVKICFEYHLKEIEGGGRELKEVKE